MTDSPTVTVVVTLNVTVTKVDTGETVTLAAASQPGYRTALADLLEDDLASITRELVERVEPSVFIVAEQFIGGE